MSFRPQLLATIFVAFGLPVNAVDTYQAFLFRRLMVGKMTITRRRLRRLK